MSVSFCHSVTDTYFSKNMFRSCRIFFYFTTDVCHVNTKNQVRTLPEFWESKVKSLNSI